MYSAIIIYSPAEKRDSAIRLVVVEGRYLTKACQYLRLLTRRCTCISYKR